MNPWLKALISFVSTAGAVGGTSMATGASPGKAAIIGAFAGAAGLANLIIDPPGRMSIPK